MADDFAVQLRTEVPRWVRSELVSSEQGEAILARYPVSAAARRRAGQPAWTMMLLYAAAGILIGAAAISFVVVGLGPQDYGVSLMIAGLVLFVGGTALRFAMPHSLLGDVLLIAALPPLATSPTEDPDNIAGPVAMIASAVILAWRHERPIMQALAVAAFSVASGFTYFRLFDETQALAWFLTQAALVGGMVLLDRLMREDESVFATALAVVAMGISFVAFLGDTLNIDTAEVGEAIVGLLAAAILGLGILLKARGLVLGALIVGCVDAIAFAFTVGEWVGGTVALVAIAGLLIWQAEFLKKHLAAA